MPVVSIQIPQMGEGLREARIVALLKQPGDPIKRDEPIYQIETDKAIIDVESPYEGTLKEWLGEDNKLMLIGENIAYLEVSESVAENLTRVEAHPSHCSPQISDSINLNTPPLQPILQAESKERRTDIPPRTRAYAKSKNLSENELMLIPASSSKLMPADIDAWLANSSKKQEKTIKTSRKFTEEPLSDSQRLLGSRLQRGSQLVVPGTITLTCSWENLEKLHHHILSQSNDFKPSAFTLFAYGVTLALKEFPAFRSTLVSDSSLRTYKHAHLGVAVSLPEDKLVIAVIDEADTFEWPDFAHLLRKQIALARKGHDQAHEAVTISLTNMQSTGIEQAIPVVVPPAVATLFIGAVFKGLDQVADTPQFQKQVNLSLTFDHRVINGVGAAKFLNRIKEITENITDFISL